MKILLVQDGEWRKKGPHQQHHLMELLSLKGHEIKVIGFDQLWREEKSGVLSKKIELGNVCRFHKGANITFIRSSFIRIPLLDYLSFLISSKMDIFQEGKIFKPDIVIGYSAIISCFWGLKLARKLNIPFIYYCVDNPSVFNIQRYLMPIGEFLSVYIMKNSHEVWTINKALNDYVIGLGIIPHRTFILPQGVDLKRFILSQDIRKKVRERYNVKEDETLLFFMGWLYTFSGLKEVIADLSEYSQRNKSSDIKKIKLMIVGYGDDYENLKKLISSRNMENQVIMTGKMPYEEIPILLSAADICLLPSHNDDVIRDIAPIKIYEYLAMEKPVISTKLSGMIKEFGIDNGVIYVDRPNDVIKRVHQLSSEDIKLNGFYARKFIETYNWDNIISILEIKLQSLTNK